MQRAQKRGAEDEAIGRWRGGPSTKINAAVDALGNPLGFILTGGHVHDSKQAEALIDGFDFDKLLADLSAFYRRLRGRRGPKEAILAVAAAILTAAYQMLKTGTPTATSVRSILRPAPRAPPPADSSTNLAGLGYAVEIKPLATAQPPSASL